MSSLHCGLHVSYAYSRLEPYELETQPLRLEYWDSCAIVHCILGL
jgi:hypothetical protein